MIFYHKEGYHIYTGNKSYMARKAVWVPIIDARCHPPSKLQNLYVLPAKFLLLDREIEISHVNMKIITIYFLVEGKNETYELRSLGIWHIFDCLYKQAALLASSKLRAESIHCIHTHTRKWTIFSSSSESQAQIYYALMSQSGQCVQVATCEGMGQRQICKW